MGWTSKIVSKADVVSFAVSYYGHYGDLGSAVTNITDLKSRFNELKNTLTWKGLLMAKLGLNGDPTYGENIGGTMTRYAAYAWILSELGILAPKWKNTAKKVMKGAGLACLTLPASIGRTGAPTMNSMNQVMFS